MKSGEEQSPEFELTSLIQHIQLVPEKADKKVSRWQKVAGILSRVIRSRFGLRSAELVDRYTEAKVASVEGEAKVRHAEAIERLGKAAVDFAKARQIAKGDNSSQTSVEGSPNVLKGQAKVEAVIAELTEAIVTLEKKGATLEIHLADADPDLPKLPYP